VVFFFVVCNDVRKSELQDIDQIREKIMNKGTLVIRTRILSLMKDDLARIVVEFLN